MTPAPADERDDGIAPEPDERAPQASAQQPASAEAEAAPSAEADAGEGGPQTSHEPSAQPPVPPTPAVPDAVAEAVDDIYRISLDVFEGPLDLLLHLIQKHELDIFDIPVSFVTKKYLEYLEWMTTLQIDVASEYLVMAAQLAYIKSRMLLPEPPPEVGDEEGLEPEDPRAELVRRLLEYQKYKDAAHQLGGRDVLDRDVFERGAQEPEPEGVAPFAPVSVFKLFEAFDDVLRRAHRSAEHEVVFERISLAERIVELTELLHDRGRLRFEELFEHAGMNGDQPGAPPSKFALVVTFLALLEMTRLGVAQVIQERALETLYIQFTARDASLPISAEDVERLEAPGALAPPATPHFDDVEPTTEAAQADEDELDDDEDESDDDEDEPDDDEDEPDDEPEDHA